MEDVLVNFSIKHENCFTDLNKVMKFTLESHSYHDPTPTWILIVCYLAEDNLRQSGHKYCETITTFRIYNF